MEATIRNFRIVRLRPQCGNNSEIPMNSKVPLATAYCKRRSNYFQQIYIKYQKSTIFAYYMIY